MTKPETETCDKANFKHQPNLSVGSCQLQGRGDDHSLQQCPGPAKTAPGSSCSASPSTNPAPPKPKIPLICWDGDCAYCTTRLLDWCLENEAACIKIFSDSTQEAKDSGWKREVPTHSKNYYLQQAASAIFANDPNEQVWELSKMDLGEFASRIARHLKE